MPTATVEKALEEYQRGKIVIIVDDEDRENEGDLAIAAEKVTPEAVNFIGQVRSRTDMRCYARPTLGPAPNSTDGAG